MIFLNSASSAAALVFYLPGVCTHTEPRENRVQNIFKNSEKTQYLMNTLYNPNKGGFVSKETKVFHVYIEINGLYVP